MTGGGLLHIFDIVSVTCNLSLDDLLLCKEKQRRSRSKIFFLSSMSFTFSHEAEKWSFPQKTHCIAVDPLGIFSCGLVNSVDVVAGFPDFLELEKLLNGFTLSVVALICSVLSQASISF